jgi:hypothetical protein
VLAAVHFNNQFLIEADEIRDISADVSLPAKFMAEYLPAAQVAPQLFLRVRHRLAQTARVLGGFRHGTLFIWFHVSGIFPGTTGRGRRTDDLPPIP